MPILRFAEMPGSAGPCKISERGLCPQAPGRGRDARAPSGGLIPGAECARVGT